MKLLTGLVAAGIVGLMGLGGCQNMQNAGHAQGRGNMWGQGRGQQSHPVTLTMADGHKVEVVSVRNQETIAGHKFLNVTTPNGPMQVRIEHIATVEGGTLQQLVSPQRGSNAGSMMGNRGPQMDQRGGRGGPEQGGRGMMGRGGPQDNRGGRGGWNDEGPNWQGRGGPGMMGGGWGRGRMGGGPGMMGPRGPMGGPGAGPRAPEDQKKPPEKSKPDGEKKEPKPAPKKEGEPKKADTAPKA